MNNRIIYLRCGHTEAAATAAELNYLCPICRLKTKTTMKYQITLKTDKTKTINNVARVYVNYTFLTLEDNEGMIVAAFNIGEVSHIERINDYMDSTTAVTL